MRGVQDHEQVDLAARRCRSPLKAQPRIGMSPSQGTLLSFSCLHVGEDSADHHRLAVAHVDGVLDLAVGRGGAERAYRSSRVSASGTTSLISWKTFNRTVSPSLICGVTRRVTPTSWREMFWRGLEGAVRIGRGSGGLQARGRDRDVLADHDLRFLLVRGEDGRRGDDVRRSGSRIRRGDRARGSTAPGSSGPVVRIGDRDRAAEERRHEATRPRCRRWSRDRSRCRSQFARAGRCRRRACCRPWSPWS